jgi:hypothetical protein
MDSAHTVVGRLQLVSENAMTRLSSNRHRTAYTILAFVVLSGGVLNQAFSSAAGQKWKRSTKTDGIEKFYQTDKTGTDTFAVDVRVRNTRSKRVKATVRVEYKPTTQSETETLTNIVTGSTSRQLPVHECTVTVEPNASSVCETITIRAQKVTGVTITKWTVIE